MRAKQAIRMFGYVLYVTLWLPVIIIALIVTPFVWLRVFGKAGFTFKESAKAWGKTFMAGIRHDIHYIKTGEW